MERWRMLVRPPDGEERRLEVRAGLTIGRHPESDLVLDDPLVSRRHATLVEQGGKLCLKDIGSQSGTRIDKGPKLGPDQGHPLAHGMVAYLGKVALEFQRDDEPASEPESATMRAVLEDDVTRPSAVTQPRAVAAPPRPAREPEVRPAPVPEPSGESTAPALKRTPAAEPAPPPAAEEQTVRARPIPPAVPYARKEAPRAEPASSPAPPERKPSNPPSAPAPAARPVPAKDAAESGADLDVGPAGETVPIIPNDGPTADRVFLEAARARLVIDDEANPRIVAIDEVPFWIGREAKECRIEHDRVSAKHAQIVFTKSQRFELHDNQSKNGTFVGVDLRKVMQHDLRSETPLRFGMVDALFVTDSDHNGAKLPRAVHERAAEALRRSKVITREQLQRARKEARDEKRHVGERLIVNRAIGAMAWARAYEAARDRRGNPAMWIVVGLVAVAVVAAVAFLAMQLGKG